MTISTRRTRLTPAREQEVFEAVLDLVREHGYGAVTMDAIAARSRSSKATLYRQWESKPTLVMTALRNMKRLAVADVDTGSLTADLHEIVQMIGEQACEFTSLMQAMGHAIMQDPELDRAFRELLVEPELAAFDAVIRRSIDRGEVAADNPATEYVAHMLLGALTARPLIENLAADAAYLSQYLELVVLPALNLR